MKCVGFFFTRSVKPKKSSYFQDEVDVSSEGLNSVETGDESNWQETLLVHLSTQKEVPLQIFQTEVVLTTGREDVHNQLILISAPLILFFSEKLFLKSSRGLAFGGSWD